LDMSISGVCLLSPNPMGCGSVMGRWSLPFVLHALKIIN
jgi:hypothetical protein